MLKFFTELIFMRRLFVYLCLLPFLAGCASIVDPTKDWSAERFYTEGKKALEKKNYATAIKHFETLEARYPYGPYAEQAELEMAYAYYKDSEPASAIAGADRFIRMHPTHPNVDYAYYLKGLASYDEQPTFLDRMMGKHDISDRDPKAVREAFDAFRELVTRFPNSKYADDAGRRMYNLMNALAQNEIHVAKYYFSRAAYVAAVNRCKYVIEHYQRATALEDALGIQVKAYKMMGLNQLANDSLRVLEQNFPQSRYIQEIKNLAVS